MRTRGFTLIETIFATLILAFVVLFIFNLYPSSFLAIKRGEGTLEADSISQGIIEDLRAQPFSTIRNNPNPSYANVIYGGTTYSPSVQIFNVTGANVNFLVGCNVSVGWTMQNSTHQVSHEAYFHNVTH